MDDRLFTPRARLEDAGKPIELLADLNLLAVVTPYYYIQDSRSCDHLLQYIDTFALSFSPQLSFPSP